MRLSMEIVLVNQSTSYLMIDIANAYAEKYEKVVLFAGCIKEFERPLSKKIKIEQIKPYNKSSLYSRVWSWLVAFIQIAYRINRHYKDSYVVYVTNPPMSYWTALFTKNRYSIIEYDIYPDALRNIGISESNPISKIWSLINRKLFNKADYIYALSDGMKRLLSKYVDENRVKVIYNWSSNSDLRPIAKSDNPFILEHHLQDKFVVMYSGNIGYTHNVELIIELAIRFKDDNSIHFVIIGNGGKKQDLLKQVEVNGLQNCIFLDWQPADRIKYSLAAADLSVVTLTEETALVSVPSKTYNILAVGSPLLCIAPKNSEIAKLVQEETCGAVFEKTELKMMSLFLEQLKENRVLHKEMSKNARRASRKYTLKNAKNYLL